MTIVCNTVYRSYRITYDTIFKEPLINALLSMVPVHECTLSKLAIFCTHHNLPTYMYTLPHRNVSRSLSEHVQVRQKILCDHLKIGTCHISIEGLNRIRVRPFTRYPFKRPYRHYLFTKITNRLNAKPNNS